MDQLLVALDVETAAQAETLTQQLSGVAGGFKIGSRLFTAEGPRFVRHLTDRGVRVFLDLKFHDIPNTVAEAVTEATRLGVWMMTIHTSGGAAMMQAAAQGILRLGSTEAAPPAMAKSHGHRRQRNPLDSRSNPERVCGPLDRRDSPEPIAMNLAHLRKQAKNLKQLYPEPGHLPSRRRRLRLEAALFLP